MEIAQRNENAKTYIIDKLNFVSSLNEPYFQQLSNFQSLKEILTNLIFVNAKGFRGVVATAITGKFLNPDYDPLNDFYGCNPRSIFEQGIFYAFENRVPCGKSDPLNVAKNINVLDDEWAKGKRPQSAAQAAVDYLRHIENSTGEEQSLIIDYFFFKLLEYSNSVTSVQINMPQQESLINQVFSAKLVEFLLKHPESGTIPQLIVATLVKKMYSGSSIVVEGGSESVFGTNTTSKKPADIWLATDNTPYNLFEITVKKVDRKRLDDCIQSLAAMDMLDQPVTFICRLPEDISSLTGVQDGALNYKNKIFNFINIRELVPSIVMFLSNNQCYEVLTELQNFMMQVDRPITTKNGWNTLFSEF